MQKKNLLTVALTAGLLFSLSALAPAPIGAASQGIARPTGRHYATQAQLQAEQSLQKKTGEIGFVPAKTEDIPVDSPAGSADGSKILNKAQSQLANSSPEQQAQARKILQAAESKLHPSSTPFMLIGLIVLGLVGGGLYGAKRWADTNIPAPIQTQRSKVNW